MILSAFHQDLLLSLFPSGTRIVQARYFQEEYLPCPVHVRLLHRGGSYSEVVLRLSRRPSGVQREAALLPVLAQHGMPVPRILAGPVVDPTTGEVATVLSMLPGQNLQDLSGQPGADLEPVCQQLVNAIAFLHRLTESLDHDLVAKTLLHNSLLDELQTTISGAGAWLGEPAFMAAAERIMPVVAGLQTPLYFTNGDYQPANFLSNGQQITGFVDFESARFEDPHIGMAKYRIYDLRPLHKAGAAELYLRANDLTEESFAPRMAVQCLVTLCREVPVSEAEQAYGRHIWSLLNQAQQML